MPKFHDQLYLGQSPTPPTPPGGQAVVYPKDDGGLYAKDDAGLEQPLGGIFVQQANPGMVRPGMWIELNPDGSVKTIWVNRAA